MNEEGKSWIDWLVAGLLAAVSFVVYAATLSTGAYPGSFSHLMVQAIGLFPRITPYDPMWHGLARLLIRVGGAGDWVGRLNLMSSVFGALSVGWTYIVCSQLTYQMIRVDSLNRIRSVTVARLAGVTAALALAFCTPFWAVSNRFHPATFHLFLLLSTTWVFLLYVQTGRVRLLLLTSLLYGLGVVEFTTFIVIAPLFAMYTIYWLWRHEQIHFGPIAGLILCGLAGVSLYVLSAWAFYGTPGYEIRGYQSFFQIILYTWRDQFFQITRSLPPVGYLTILLLTAIPWLVTLLVGFRALNEERDWAYYILHVILTGIVVSVVLNVKIAPWPMTGFRFMLVTPYLLVALLTGYLTAYWVLLPWAWWQGAEESEVAGRRRVIGGIMAALFLALVCVAPFRNARAADGRSAATIKRFAEETVRVLPRAVDYLVTDGPMDNHFLLAAREAGRPLKVLNVRASDSPVYTKYVAGLFERPRLKNLAYIGMRSLLQEWLTTDPEARRRVATLSSPEVWTEAGFIDAPHQLVFLGAAGTNDIRPEIFAEHKAFWDEFVPAMRPTGDDEDPMDTFRKNILRHMGLIANNLGVLLEDMNRDADAFQAYEKAREIDPENISALLNEWVMVNRGFPSAHAEEIKGEVAKLSETRSRDHRIWSLAPRYGYVRTPRAFVELGWEWALSGRPGVAISGFKRALDMMTEGPKSDIKGTLAGLYLLQDEEEKSEALYHELLVENPSNRQALLGMARLATRKGDWRQAAERLTQAEKAGADQTILRMEWAAMHIAAGEWGKARVVLEEVLQKDPSKLTAWAMLTDVLRQQRDESGMQNALRQLRDVKGSEKLTTMITAELAVLQNDLDKARQMFSTLLREQPDSVYVLVRLLRLDMAQNRKSEATTHVKKLLSLAPDHSLGNYVMGSLQLETGEVELAEDSFRKSLETVRTPEALNDLAWLLQRRAEYEEAERLIVEALKKQEKIYTLWDTYGTILMKTGRVKEAEEAFDQALGLYKKDPVVLLHMAEVRIKRGNPKQALEMIEMLSDRGSELSAADVATLDRLRREALSPQ